MEGNDIAPWTRIGQGTIFEGVLASPPVRRVPSLREVFKTRDWDSLLADWNAHDIPLKSMIDHVNRLGIQTQVYTFLAQEAVDPIERWLVRKGVSTPVVYYESPTSLAQDLLYDRSIHNVFVPDIATARLLGARATVVGPNTMWSR